MNCPLLLKETGNEPSFIDSRIAILLQMPVYSAGHKTFTPGNAGPGICPLLFFGLQDLLRLGRTRRLNSLFQHQTASCQSQIKAKLGLSVTMTNAFTLVSHESCGFV